MGKYGNFLIASWLQFPRSCYNSWRSGGQVFFFNWIFQNLFFPFQSFHSGNPNLSGRCFLSRFSRLRRASWQSKRRRSRTRSRDGHSNIRKQMRRAARL